MSPEAHLYYELPDETTPIMLVVEDSGDLTLGVSHKPQADPMYAGYFFEAWPVRRGVDEDCIAPPWTPIQGEMSDGTPCIMGVFTPKGEYAMIQYDEHGQAEAVVQMNEVDARMTIPAASE